MTNASRTISFDLGNRASVLSKASSQLFKNLTRPLTAEMLLRFESRRKVLEDRLSRLEVREIPISPETMNRLVRARWIGSQSLSPLLHDADSVRQAEAAWHEANAFVLERVRLDQWPDIESITQINQLVVASKGGIRKHEALLDDRLCPDPKDLPILIDGFESFVLEDTESHPLILAAKVYQWLCSIHAFADGNGRTARLASDWILALAGYPPVTYTLVPPIVSLDLEVSPRFSADHAGEILLAGVESTVALLED